MNPSTRHQTENEHATFERVMLLMCLILLATIVFLVFSRWRSSWIKIKNPTYTQMTARHELFESAADGSAP